MINKISFYSHSGLYTLQTKTIVKGSLKNAWEFFSNPNNLKLITPKKMNFEITSRNFDSISPGQIISYKVGIVSLIKSNWVTEITNVKKEAYFIDEQRFGPYKMWHHEHYFEEISNGILITDKVTYKLPLGILGRITHALFVKNQLIEIFNYRTKKIKSLF